MAAIVAEQIQRIPQLIRFGTVIAELIRTDVNAVATKRPTAVDLDDGKPLRMGVRRDILLRKDDRCQRFTQGAIAGESQRVQLISLGERGIRRL